MKLIWNAGTGLNKLVFDLSALPVNHMRVIQFSVTSSVDSVTTFNPGVTTWGKGETTSKVIQGILHNATAALLGCFHAEANLIL